MASYKFKVIKGGKVIGEATTRAEAEAAAKKHGGHVAEILAGKTGSAGRRGNPSGDVSTRVYFDDQPGATPGWVAEYSDRDGRIITTSEHVGHPGMPTRRNASAAANRIAAAYARELSRRGNPPLEPRGAAVPGQALPHPRALADCKRSFWSKDGRFAIYYDVHGVRLLDVRAGKVIATTDLDNYGYATERPSKAWDAAKPSFAEGFSEAPVSAAISVAWGVKPAANPKAKPKAVKAKVAAKTRNKKVVPSKSPIFTVFDTAGMAYQGSSEADARSAFQASVAKGHGASISRGLDVIEMRLDPNVGRASNPKTKKAPAKAKTPKSKPTTAKASGRKIQYV